MYVTVETVHSKFTFRVIRVNPPVCPKAKVIYIFLWLILMAYCAVAYKPITPASRGPHQGHHGKQQPSLILDLTFTFTAKVIKSTAGPPKWRNQLSPVKRNEHWLDNFYYNRFFLQSLQLHPQTRSGSGDPVGPPRRFTAFKSCLSQDLELAASR